MAEVFFCHFFMNDLPIPRLNPSLYKAIVFDFDGTLYNLQKMQKIMRKEIWGFLVKNPQKWKEIQAVYHFRKHRKKARGQYVAQLASTQYTWVTESTGIPLREVQAYIRDWMFERPLKYLPDLVYPGVYDFVEVLEKQSIPWAIFSDLEVKEKAAVLGFPSSKAYAASDPGIDSLKPKPVGLIKIAQDMGIETKDILFIGDQEELDGYCAKQAACDFVWIKPQYAKQQYRELIACFS